MIFLQEVEDTLGEKILLSSFKIIPHSWCPSLYSPEKSPAIWAAYSTLHGATWVIQVNLLPLALQIGQYSIDVRSKNPGARETGLELQLCHVLIVKPRASLVL